MASGRIVISQERCKGCGLCVAACSPGVIEIDSTLNALGYRPAILRDPSHLCTGCGICAMVCPDAGILVYRTIEPARATQAMAEVA